MVEKNSSKEGDLNDVTKSKTKSLYISKNEFLDAMERKCMESDKVTKENALNITQKKNKANTILWGDGANKDNKFNSRSG